jgi:hypothetical protein
MRKLTTALATACALALAMPAMAQQGPGGMQKGQGGGQQGGPGGGQQGGPGGGQQGQGGKQGPSPEQFQKMKSKMLENHQKRAAIIQQGSSCIQSASAPEQLKSCIQQERQAEEQLRDEIKKEMGNRQHQGGGMGDHMGDHESDD